MKYREDYGKLVNNELQFAPVYLEIGNNNVWNASSAEYLAQGWLPIIYTAKPTAPYNYDYVPEYTEENDTIVQSWVLVESPVKYSIEEIGSNSFTGDIIYNGTRLHPYMFAGSTITSFESDTVTSMSDVGGTGNGDHVFYNCKQLRSVRFANSVGTGSGGYQLAGCTALVNVSMPKQTSLGQYMFYGDTALEVIVLPSLTGNMNGNTFRGCTKLKAVDMKQSSATSQNTFYGCTVLDTLILRGSTVTTLTNINAFTNTPFASGKSGGTLYVPQSMIASFQSASNWSTILGYANNQILAIEGSTYETKYADGTDIPQS